MPSPIAHSLVGYLIYRITTKPFKGQKRYIILLYMFVANIPDLDFLPGIFVGSVSRYHHGISHSIGFSFIFALSCYIILVILRKGHIKRSFAIAFCLFFSHIVLDYLTKVSDKPYGELFLWPFSNEYYIASFAFFPVIHFHGSVEKFLFSLLSLQNLIAIGVEIAILAPIIIIMELCKSGRKPQNSISRQVGK